jgi:hypothetical protein
MQTNKASIWIASVFGFILACSMMFQGCNATIPAPLVSPTGTITSVQGDIGKDAITLQGTTTTIQQTATNGQKATPQAVAPVLTPYWQTLLVQAGIQQDVITDLKQQATQLTAAVNQSNQLQTALANETTVAQKAQAALHDALNQKLILLIIVGVLGLGSAVWLGFSGSRLGIGVGLTSGTLIAASLVIMKLNTINLPPVAVYIGIGVLGVICVGFGIYYYIKHKSTIATVTAKNTVLNTQTVALATAKAGLELNLTATTATLESLSQKHNELVQSHQVVVGKLESITNEKQRLTQVNQVIQTTSDVKIEVLTQRIGKVEEKNNDLETRITTVEKDSTDVKMRLPVIEKRSSLAKKIAENTKSYVEGINAGMARSSKPSGLDIWTGRAAG